MPAYHVASTTTISASSADIHKALDNFREWPVWSPWLYMERDANLDYRGQAGQIGHGYDWSGNLTGSGSMTLTQNTPQELKMDLVFLKPFKSKAKVRFDVIEKSSSETGVTWHLDGKLPFFMFFMTGMMKSMISMDYDRGLKMLKEYVETGSVKSVTEVHGIVDIDPRQFVGLTTDSTMKDLGDSMSKTLPDVYQAATGNNMTINGPIMAIYNRMNIKAQNCTYTAAIPVENTSSVDAPMHIGQIIGCRALKVTHRGAYEHLGNAWATAIGNQRHQKLKPSKQQSPFEVYVSDPDNTATEDLVTDIYVPVR